MFIKVNNQVKKLITEAVRFHTFMEIFKARLLMSNIE